MGPLISETETPKLPAWLSVDFRPRATQGEGTMPDEFETLVNLAKRAEMTPEQSEEQRRSFAFGNTRLENARVTREMINEQAADLKSRHEDDA